MHRVSNEKRERSAGVAAAKPGPAGVGVPAQQRCTVAARREGAPRLDRARARHVLPGVAWSPPRPPSKQQAERPHASRAYRGSCMEPSNCNFVLGNKGDTWHTMQEPKDY